LSYRDAIHRLYALRSRGIKLDLDRVSEASHILGDPHREMGRVIQIAGTNGKGSTAAMIDRIVREAGLRSGFFSSPHLHRFGERIVVDGTPLADDVLEPRILEILGRQDDGSMPELSFFEIATLLAFEAFRDAGTDVAVLEVGLGGRLDATNVADADVAVITRVAHDHGSILGHELSQIAAEKAGIISRGKPVVSTRQDPRARAVLEAVAAERDAPLSILGRDFQVRPTRAGVHSFVDVVVGDETVRGLSLGLEGSHQVDNAACAVAAVIALRDAGISIDHGAIAGGLEKTRWPGRRS
jgi:dihydrofolate synthase/folylpolyglutamate synthase